VGGEDLVVHRNHHRKEGGGLSEKGGVLKNGRGRCSGVTVVHPRGGGGRASEYPKASFQGRESTCKRKKDGKMPKFREVRHEKEKRHCSKNLESKKKEGQQDKKDRDLSRKKVLGTGREQRKDIP